MESHEAKSDLSVEQALFGGKVQAVVVSCYENERPLLGLAGLIDWRFGGEISRYIRKGIITGKKGEITWVPLKKMRKPFHVFVLGAGRGTKPGHRGAPPAESLENLRNNLMSLKLEKVGVSLTDMGGIDGQSLALKLKGVNLWTLQ